MNSYSSFAIEYIDILNADGLNEECNIRSGVVTEITTEVLTSTTLESELPTVETDKPDDVNKFFSKQEFDRIMDMLNKFKDECFNLDFNESS